MRPLIGISTYARAGELIEQLKADIGALLEKAERADTAPEQKQALPAELARREALREKLEAARAALEARARQQAQREQPAYEAKVQERAQREGRRKGPEPQPPRVEPEPGAQINLSDAPSRLMRKSRNEAFEQSYNAQAAVCADGSQLIVGARVSTSSSDANELEPTLCAIPATVGRPERVLVDSGYLNRGAFARVMDSGLEVYGAVAAEAALAQRRYEFRPVDRRRDHPREPSDPLLIAMKEKLASEGGRAIYARRQTSVEPAFGIIKAAIGFRQFLLRGERKVGGEWTLVTLACNCKRICRLRRAKPGTNPSPSARRLRRSPHPLRQRWRSTRKSCAQSLSPSSRFASPTDS